MPMQSAFSVQCFSPILTVVLLSGIKNKCQCLGQEIDHPEHGRSKGV